jgi:CMP-N,N'-diacetyllegionaminic acid synthase
MIKFTAVIPAREGSRRLPKKNISSFGESNLLIHKINQLQRCQYIEQIVVTSDSEEMLQMAIEQGVQIHKRSIEYCDEVSRTFGEVVAHVASSINGEHVVWATCTAPLVQTEDYDKAIEGYLFGLQEGYDSLMSVEPFKRYIWDDKRPLNYELGVKHLPSQQLEQLFFVTDGILIAPRKKMIEWSYFHGVNPKKFILEKIKCVDIDDNLDLLVAKAWLKELR